MMCLVLPLRPGAKSVLVLVDDESSMKGLIEESGTAEMVDAQALP